MTIDVFTEEGSKAVAEQLGLDESYRVFYGDFRPEIIYGLDEIEERLEEYGSGWRCAIQEVKECLRKVKLPKGFMLVGLQQSDAENPELVFGIVDVSDNVES